MVIDAGIVLAEVVLSPVVYDSGKVVPHVDATTVRLLNLHGLVFVSRLVHLGLLAQVAWEHVRNLISGCVDFLLSTNQSIFFHLQAFG